MSRKANIMLFYSSSFDFEIQSTIAKSTILGTSSSTLARRKLDFVNCYLYALVPSYQTGCLLSTNPHALLAIINCA